MSTRETLICGERKHLLSDSRRALIEASQEETFPYDVEVCGMLLEIDQGVFSPKWFESSALFCEMFPDVKGQRILDMGCGCGVIAIHAALSGASRSDAVDIAPEAVENSQRNAERLAVSHVVRSWQSDLFSNVPARSQYDLVFWNSPWVFVEQSYRHRSLLEMSVFDPGYGLLRRFLEDAPQRLSAEGRILLAFGDFGKTRNLEDLAHEFSYSITEFATRVGSAPDHFTYMLYEMRPRR